MHHALAWLIFVGAACLEVGGDAIVRKGLRGGGAALVVVGAVLLGLYRDTAVFAYVPRAEGWGLPPVEALHAGTRVVASTTTPSVAKNDLVIAVDPLDVTSIAEGLTAALHESDDELSRFARRQSVAELTWRNVALDHMAAWQ